MPPRPRRRSRLVVLATVVLALSGPASDARASRVVSQEPGHLVVQLTRGEPLVVPIEWRVATLAEAPLDVFLLADRSGSFAGAYIRLAADAPALVTALRALQPDTWFGFSTFVEKPLAPFGGADDWVYATHLPLGVSDTALKAAFSAPRSAWGRDLQDAQLEALLQVARRAQTEVAFRPDAQRVVVLTTDGPPHLEADGLARGLPPNDGDDVLDGSPPGSGESYPSLPLLRDALLESGVVPVFSVTSLVVPTYQAIVDELGFGAVATLGPYGTGAVAAIRDGLGGLRHALRPAADGDARGVVESIEPPEATDVAPGETRSFAVTLRWNGGSGVDGGQVARSGALWLRTGHGDVRIDVTLEGAAACADGLDNDGDGSTDFLGDVMCFSANDDSEHSPCADGVDNDGDGLVDWPEDPSCPNDGRDSTVWESTGCSDGADNDGDGQADYPADPDCATAAQWREDGGYCGLLGIELLLAPALALARRRLRLPSRP